MAQFGNPGAARANLESKRQRHAVEDTSKTGMTPGETGGRLKAPHISDPPVKIGQTLIRGRRGPRESTSILESVSLYGLSGLVNAAFTLLRRSLRDLYPARDDWNKGAGDRSAPTCINRAPCPKLKGKAEKQKPHPKVRPAAGGKTPRNSKTNK